jgi:YHS domain-containing protein
MKTIFILLILYIAYVVIKGFLARGAFRPVGGADVEDRDRPTSGAHRGAREEEGEEMVQDLVCSSYVPISSAISIESPQGTLYFCSVQCRDKFAAGGDG